MSSMSVRRGPVSDPGETKSQVIVSQRVRALGGPESRPAKQKVRPR